MRRQHDRKTTMRKLLLALTLALACVLFAPGAASAYTCSQTVSSVAALQSAVAPASAGGQVICISGGPYTTAVTLSTAATTRVTVASANPAAQTTLGGGVTINSSHLGLDSLILQNATAGGSCVLVQPGTTVRTDLLINATHINNCKRDGVKFARPENTAGALYWNAPQISGNIFSAIGTGVTVAGDGNAITLYATSARILNNNITGVPNDAIELWGASPLVQGNTIHDLTALFSNHNDGIQTWTGLVDGKEGQVVTGATVERNNFYNLNGPDAHGIMVEGAGVNSWNVRSNIFRSVGSFAANFGKVGNGAAGSETGEQFYNNTVVGSGKVEYPNGTTGAIENDIFRNVGVSGAPPYDETAATNDYNETFGGATLTETHGLSNVNPLFVNETTFDYHLQTGSPAINSGGTVIPARPTDFAGNTGVVGVVDRGAYER